MSSHKRPGHHRLGRAHANDAGVRVVEVDVDTTAYDQGHVPGAVGWNWTTDSATRVVARHRPKDKFEELLGKSGIDNDTTIVLYGDNNNWFAAWAFWQLKIYGHEDVRIMDGGRKKWLAEGRELDHRQAVGRRRTPTRPRPPTTRCARSCPMCSRRSTPKSGVARRRPQPAGIHRRDPRAARIAGNLPARRPHSRRRRASRGRRRATTTAPSRAARS